MGKYIEEFDHLMMMDDAGIMQYDDEMALDDRIREWFETPQGSISDLPAWGHNLSRLKFEPAGISLNVMARLNVMEKMPHDIANLQILSIGLNFLEVDRLIISINYGLGTFQGEVKL